MTDYLNFDEAVDVPDQIKFKSVIDELTMERTLKGEMTLDDVANILWSRHGRI